MIVLSILLENPCIQLNYFVHLYSERVLIYVKAYAGILSFLMFFIIMKIMSTVTYMSEEGLRKLKEEFEELTTVERPKISKQIAEARDKGDLSENAEYDAAKEAQGLLEMKISQLQETLRSARVIDESKIDTGTVQLMNKVKIKNIKTGAVMEYTIVSEREANLKEKKMSVETPIAKGLIGKKKGDKVNVTVPAGKMSFEILEISL